MSLVVGCVGYSSCLLLFLSLLAPSFVLSLSDQRVILLSLDAFRHDYLELYPNAVLPALRAFRASGTWSPTGMRNNYVTITLPNHVTLTTGVPVDQHGMVNNFMYDDVLKETFTAWTEEKDIDCCNVAKSTRWFADAAEPIWIANQRAGGQSASIMFPFTKFLYQNESINHHLCYDSFVPYEDRVDLLLDYMTGGGGGDSSSDSSVASRNLGLLYFEETDRVGHVVGPHSDKMELALQRVDRAVGYLMRRLNDLGMTDTTNVIIVADHGMTTVKRDNLVDVRKTFVGSATQYVGYVMLGGEAAVSPVSAYNSLAVSANHVRFIPKPQVPDFYGFKNHRRIGDIVTFLDEGYYMKINDEHAEGDLFTAKLAATQSVWGNHGFDNQYSSMWPIFMTSGPVFRNNNTVNHFNSTVIYCLVCLILDIRCHPDVMCQTQLTQPLLKGFFKNPQHFENGPVSHQWNSASYQAQIEPLSPIQFSLLAFMTMIVALISCSVYLIYKKMYQKSPDVVQYWKSMEKEGRYVLSPDYGVAEKA